jgi:hypothetical protein
MYGALWRVLPGPVWLRIVILLVLAAAAAWALLFWVYPEVNSLLPVDESTVQNG